MSNKDIRLDMKVRATYWAMTGQTSWPHQKSKNKKLPKGCVKCVSTRTASDVCSIPDPIPLSVAELAEYMMRMCDEHDYVKALSKIVALGHHMCMATPEHRIRAACAAWEVKHETRS